MTAGEPASTGPMGMAYLQHARKGCPAGLGCLRGRTAASYLLKRPMPSAMSRILLLSCGSAAK